MGMDSCVFRNALGRGASWGVLDSPECVALTMVGHTTDSQSVSEPGNA